VKNRNRRRATIRVKLPVRPLFYRRGDDTHTVARLLGDLIIGVVGVPLTAGSE
jgi:hypothetical protein